MPDPDPTLKPKVSSPGDQLAKQVGLRETRMLRRKKDGGPNFWRAVALVGFVGWSVVLPMLIGVATGIWIDHRWPSRYSWTLMLLVAGLAIGCANAWNRIRQAQEDR